MSLERSTSLVVDAAAIVEYLLGSELGVAVASIIESPDSQLNAPAVCDVEVLSALRRAVRLGVLDVERAKDAIVDYASLPLVKHGHGMLLARIFDLRDSFTASDASYVALCERLGATLVTCDGRLTRATGERLSLNVIGVT